MKRERPYWGRRQIARQLRYGWHDRPELLPWDKGYCKLVLTKIEQIAFHSRLYYAGVAHAGKTVQVTPSQEGLVVYNDELAWLTTCPWRQSENQYIDKPLCPT